MIGFVFLAQRVGFFDDILLPAAVLVVVFAWIGNSLLNRLTGYSLW